MSLLSRRNFISFSLYSSLSALAAATIYPIIRFILPPKIPQAVQNEVVAAKIGELNPNSSKIFKFGPNPGILILTEDGKYKAFSATCTHLDCIVQYQTEMKHIWCACHNGHFDLFGKNLSGPPPAPLEEYTVTLINDEIIVSKKI
ncbi:MAG TPA: ubiquinol-cytochrome c reductase iron-sulfur subunit [bacterium]|nr:ubiquinol-cytochrome c reductase iron-sulfur subunit [bacterium]